MKGDRKRRLHGFRMHPEHIAKSPRLSPEDIPTLPDATLLTDRLDMDEFEDLVTENLNGTMTIRDNGGKQLRARVLRPRRQKPDFYQEYVGENSTDCDNLNIFTNVVMNCYKVELMWNQCFKDHQAHEPDCCGSLTWNDPRQWGMCWNSKLRCRTCTFISTRFNLYEEVSRIGPGRKAAKPNVGIQIGMARHGFSSTGLIDVLNSANIIAPSKPGLQLAANKLNPIIVQTNTEDMAKRAEHLKYLNERRGLSRSDGISAEADGTYNNRLGSGFGNTPFQAATQATFLMCENLTPKKQIIQCGTYSRSCTCGKSVQFKGKHKVYCGANIPYSMPIGNEGAYLSEAVTQLNQQGLNISTLTIDGDSNANTAAARINQPEKLTIQRCTRHLRKSLEKDIKKTKFSDGMFTQMGSTKHYRKQAQNRLALDIGRRCSAEFQQAHSIYKDMPHEMMDKLPLVPNSIVDCYMGTCAKCETFSFVCHGGLKKWQRSFLNVGPLKYRRLTICPNTSDRFKLQNSMMIRLGVKAVISTIQNRTQNKCEAANRGLSKALPKHLNFKHNYAGRAHSAIFSMNNMPGVALLKMAQRAGAPITPGSKVVKQLKQKDITVLRDRLRKKAMAYKTARANSRAARYDLHAGMSQQSPLYKKGMGDEIFKVTSQKCPPSFEPQPGPSSASDF